MPKTGQKLPTREVVILAFDGVQPIDVSGPAQAFATANELGDFSAYVVRLCTLSNEKIRTASGFHMAAEQVPDDLDIDTLIIPGGPGVHDPKLTEADYIEALRRLCARSRRICSICTGAFLLARTGLLADRRAVTHWCSCDRFQREYPNVQVDSDSIFLRDDNLWTSAGVTAGIDLTLALIEEDHDTALTSRIARQLVVYMRRPGGQNQYSEPLSLQESASAHYGDLLQQITSDPAFPWTPEDMACAARQSLRSFYRQFADEVGATPAKALERIRVELARTYLHTTDMRLKQIAAKTGFHSEKRMRDAMLKHFGISPKEMRDRF